MHVVYSLMNLHNDRYDPLYMGLVSPTKPLIVNITILQYSYMNLTINSTVKVDVIVVNKITKQAFSIVSGVTECNTGFQINIGNYTLLITSNQTGYVKLRYLLIPIYAIPYFGSGNGFPTGLVYYGVINKSGGLVGIPVNTTEVVGYALINSLGAYSIVNGTKVFGTALQMNMIIEVLTLSGTKQFYWVQISTRFLINMSMIGFTDIVWNFTTPYSTLNASGLGKHVSTTAGYAYFYGSGAFPFDLPVLVRMEVRTYVNQTTQYPILQFFYIVKYFASPYPPDIFSDNVTLYVKAKQAYIEANPYFRTEGGVSGYLYNDVELVFTGMGNGYSAHFYKLNAVLGLYYLNGSELVKFPSFLDFGVDTAEGATNVAVDLKDNPVHFIAGPQKMTWIDEDPSLSYFDSYNYINYIYEFLGYVPYLLILVIIVYYIYRKIKQWLLWKKY